MAQTRADKGVDMHPASIPTLPKQGGIYVFIGVCRRAAWVDIASLGRLWVATGCYSYIGSAHGPGGIRARVGRHLRCSARRHWHIDFLRPLLHPVGVWYATAGREQEHVWAAALTAGRGVETPAPGFGASDCACASHLFWSLDVPSHDNFNRRLRSCGGPEGTRVDVL